MLRRDAWYELTYDGFVLAISKWTSDRESLATALKETGWFHSTGAAMSAADDACFHHTWHGIDPDAGEAVLCGEDGDGGRLLEVAPITVVDVGPLIG